MTYPVAPATGDQVSVMTCPSRVLLHATGERLGCGGRRVRQGRAATDADNGADTGGVHGFDARSCSRARRWVKRR